MMVEGRLPCPRWLPDVSLVLHLRRGTSGSPFLAPAIKRATPLTPVARSPLRSLHQPTTATKTRTESDPSLSPALSRRWDSPVLSGEPPAMLEDRCSSSSGSFREAGSGTDSFREVESGTPLSVVAEAFEELARSLEGGAGELRLGAFTDACSLVSVLFSCLGIAFKFAEMEYIAKVNGLLEASKTYDTLPSILNNDVRNDTVRKQGSHSRNLRRVRLGLDLIKALFEQFLSSDECSLRGAASTAYAQVCAPYHSWAIRTAVGAGMYALPTRDELLLRLNENDHSVQKEMKRYIVACSPVIEYIDNLYLSRNVSLDW